MKCDPMTGEQIKEEQEEMKFDPMTGEQIKEEQEEMKFDPMTGELMGTQQKENKKFSVITNIVTKAKNIKKVPAIIIAVLAVVIVIFCGIKSDILASKSTKVLIAISNTFADQGYLIEDLALIGQVKPNKCKMEFTGSSAGSEIKLEVNSDASRKQILGVADIQGIPEIEFSSLLTKDKLQVQIPIIGDSIFSYNYRDEKNGYITELFDEEEIELIDMYIESIYDSALGEEFKTKMLKECLKEYRSLEFKKIDKEEFEIDGKEHQCKGYSVTITGENLHNIFDSMEKLCEEYYSDEVNEELAYYFEDLHDQADIMNEIDLSFYIYKNKLAAILLEDQEAQLLIEFLGGDARMQNIKMSVDGMEVLELKGDTTGSVEESKLVMQEITVLETEYDHKSGELTVEIIDEYLEDSVEYKFQIESKKNQVSIELKDINGNDIEDMDVKGSLTVSTQPTFEELDGEIIDLNNLDEDDLDGVIDEIQALAYEMW